MSLFNKRPDEIKPRYQSARSMLIVAALFGLADIFMTAFDSGRAFLFSLQLPHGITNAGYGWYNAGAISAVTFGVLIGASCLICLFYLFCWYRSKTGPAWLVFALVLFIVDCIVLVSSFQKERMPDLIFHAIVLYALVGGVLDAGRRKRAAQQGQPDDLYDPARYASLGHTGDENGEASEK